MVNKDMTIQSIIEAHEDVAPILMASGMHCLGCPASRGETIEEACEVHGTDADELVNKINEFLESKESK